MTDILRNKDAQGVPSSSNAGGFATRPERPDAAVTLPKPERPTVPIVGSVRLAAHESTLPPYPAHLPAADVSFSYGSDHPETVYVYTSVGTGPDTVMVTVWCDEDGEGNSIHDGAEETGWDENTDEEFLAWAHVVRSRIESDAAAVAEAALPKPVEDAIVKNALGAPAWEVQQTATGFNPTESPITRGQRVVDKMFTAYPSGDTKQEEAQDFLTDLHHWATANGVNLDEAMNEARYQHRADVKEYS